MCVCVCVHFCWASQHADLLFSLLALLCEQKQCDIPTEGGIRGIGTLEFIRESALPL